MQLDVAWPTITNPSCALSKQVACNPSQRAPQRRTCLPVATSWHSQVAPVPPRPSSLTGVYSASSPNWPPAVCKQTD